MPDKQLGEHAVHGGVDAKHEPVFAQKELFRRIGGGMSVNGSLVRERRNYGRGGAACHGAHGHGEMITNVMEVGEGSSNVAKMRKVRVPRRRGRKKLVK